MTSTEQPAPDRARQRRGILHDARLILGTLILAGLVVFALDNRRSTHVSWVIGSGDEALAVLLAGAAIAGAVIGWLYVRRPRHDHD